jgi:hypothetical protein
MFTFPDVRTCVDWFLTSAMIYLTITFVTSKGWNWDDYDRRKHMLLVIIGVISELMIYYLWDPKRKRKRKKMFIDSEVQEFTGSNVQEFTLFDVQMCIHGFSALEIICLLIDIFANGGWGWNPYAHERWRTLFLCVAVTEVMTLLVYSLWIDNSYDRYCYPIFYIGRIWLLIVCMFWLVIAMYANFAWIIGILLSIN